MVARRALVIIDGEIQELPGGDTLAGVSGGGGGGGYSKAGAMATAASPATAVDNIYIPAGATLPSTSSSNAGNLKVSFNCSAAQNVFVTVGVKANRASGNFRLQVVDAATGTLIGAGGAWYARAVGEANNYQCTFNVMLPAAAGANNWVLIATAVATLANIQFYERSFWVDYIA